MRKIILNLAVSLDWYIEWSAGEIDWCLTDQDYGMTDFISSIDTMLMGRKSYVLFSHDMKKFFPHVEQIVFSTTLQETWVTILSSDIQKNIEKLKKSAGKDIWLFGWAKLIESLLNAKFIDEIHILIHPLILWRWTPLFLWWDERISLELISATPFSSWWVQHKYKVIY